MLLLGLVVAVVAAGVAVAWFQPQKLLIDQRVDETLPGQVTPAPSGGPVTVATGRFRSLGHTTSGRVEVLEVPGDHFSLVAMPHVEHLATRLRALLARVRSGGALQKVG